MRSARSGDNVQVVDEDGNAQPRAPVRRRAAVWSTPTSASARSSTPPAPVRSRATTTTTRPTSARCASAGTGPATSATSTPTATSTSPAATPTGSASTARTSRRSRSRTRSRTIPTSCSPRSYGVPDDQAGDQVMAGLVLRDGATFDPVGVRRRGSTRRPTSGRSGGRGTCGCCATRRRPARTRSSSARSCTRSGAADRVGGDDVFVRDRGDASVPAVHRRRRAGAPRRVRALPARPLLGPLARWTSRFTPTRRRSRAEIRAWLDDAPRAAARVRDRSTTRSRGAASGRRSSRADRWVGIHWPAEYGGRGASPVQVAIFNMEYARSRALQPVNRVGINLAGPTLLAHGTDEQKQRWLPVDPRRAARSGASSSASPRRAPTSRRCAPRATPVDGGWLLNGQKVWTSYAQFARWGICLARTDPELRSTRASRTSSSTWRRRASRSGRSCRSPARPSSTRCSSTTCSSPTTISSAG